MRPLKAAAAAVAILACGSPDPAAAEWRVVGPGIAVGSAVEGPASLAVECGGDLVLAVYRLGAGAPGAGHLTLSVDGASFEMSVSGDATRVTLTETGRESGVSPELRRLLAKGRRVELSGGVAAGLPPEQARFSLLGSREAIATVVTACGG